MTNTIYIDGFDFTNDLKTIPTTEQTTPEWGQIGNVLQNDIIQLELPIKFRTFFDNGRDITAIPVKVYNNIDEIIFNGGITEIEYNQRTINIVCQSFTTILFNSTITGDKFAYVKENALPVDVIVELLDLGEEIIKKKFSTESFTMNSVSYNKAFNIQSSQNLYFNVYCDKITYKELITKLCEVSCAILYIKNNEFYFDIYQTTIPSAVELDSDDFITYPVIKQEASDSITFNEVDIRYANDISILAIQGIEPDKASKTIVMSVGVPELEVSTTSLTTAQYIKDLYDDIYTSNKQYLEVNLRKELEDIIGKNTYVKYNNVSYRVITINSDSKIQTFIRGEAIL